MIRLATVLMLLFAPLSPAAAQETQAQKTERLRGNYYMIVSIIGAAVTIEGQCPGYRRTAQVDKAYNGITQLMHQANALHGLADQIRMAIDEMAERYKLQSDGPGFCSRILREFGPSAPNPVVEKSSR